VSMSSKDYAVAHIASMIAECSARGRAQTSTRALRPREAEAGLDDVGVAPTRMMDVTADSDDCGYTAFALKIMRSSRTLCFEDSSDTAGR